MTTLDWIAVVLLFLCWLGYGPVLSQIARWAGSLNADMVHVRRAWMTAMTHREVRLLDSQLMGHTINSASFFASTNLLLIAAVAGILFGGESALRGLAAVGAEGVPVKLLEGKLALVMACLARGLLDFIWSIRQMNYTIALIGSAPEVTEGPNRTAYGEAVSRVLNPALSAFSQGVRAYYFSLAAAAWLFGPVWLAVAVVAASGLMLWRQEGSPAARAIREARRLLQHP